MCGTGGPEQRVRRVRRRRVRAPRAGPPENTKCGVRVANLRRRRRSARRGARRRWRRQGGVPERLDVVSRLPELCLVLARHPAALRENAPASVLLGRAGLHGGVSRVCSARRRGVPYSYLRDECHPVLFPMRRPRSLRAELVLLRGVVLLWVPLVRTRDHHGHARDERVHHDSLFEKQQPRAIGPSRHGQQKRVLHFHGEAARPPPAKGGGR
mmetsp:Transcript_10351/g.34255  ORF Transcript_10351/g.34255 Transcript_10351/m.34255 type:complete len:212 (-) Transcript_10351:1287-1922(-)